MNIKSCAAAMLVMIATPALAQDRTFEFKGLNTTTAYSGPTRAMDKTCKIKAVGRDTCGRLDTMEVGKTTVFNAKSTFYNGHMVAVGASAFTSDFNDLDDAFTGKYGPATHVTTEPWQNRLGITFDNVVKTWEFADGSLVLQSIGRMQDESSFLFVANHDLPPETAVPNNF